MANKSLILAGLLSVGVGGTAWFSTAYVSASRQVVETLQQLQQKQDKANTEIREIEENYADCRSQHEECLSQITRHPHADGTAYARVDDFLENVRAGYGNMWEAAHDSSLNARDQKRFSEIIGIADVLLQCQKQLNDCAGKIEQTVEGINTTLYNEQHALAYATLCPQSGILNTVAVHNLGLRESTRQYCPYE